MFRIERPKGIKRDDPHVFLANFRKVRIGDDVAAFAAECGQPFAARLPLRDAVAWLRDAQRRLRKAWKSGDAAPLWIYPGYAGERERFRFPIYFRFPKRRDVVASPGDLMDYVQLVATRDVIDGRAKVCAKKNCRHPYFVAERGDAKFCSHACASEVSVKRFRKKKKRRKKP
jgi:hypothetical protein